MANGIQTLAKDTAIYGVSSIVGRFLNYLLTPLYTRELTNLSDYGQITIMYAWTALMMVLLTFGMETTMFRFANKESENPKHVFSTSIISVFTISSLFTILCFLFSEPLAGAMGVGHHPEYIRIMSAVVALDAFQAILFSYLRLQRKAIKFACIKLGVIFVNIFLNIFVLKILPILIPGAPHLLGWFNPNSLVLYLFIINLVCSIISLFPLLPEIKEIRYGFDSRLFKEMFHYTLPILILGLAGILNQVADKLLYPHLVPGAEGEAQLGEYGAAVKIAMIMAMLIQAFRYAYEPIVFATQNSNGEREKMYANTMKYFVIFSLLAFLVVILYMDILIMILGPKYRDGKGVIPIIMLAEIFMGVYFNLSFWYKLLDKTWWGGLFSLIGCSVLVAINLLFVPKYGYMACAWGGFAGYATCMILSYIIGQHYAPINYPLKRIGFYSIIAMAIWFTSTIYTGNSLFIKLTINTLLLSLYIVILIKRDLPLRSIPFINRFMR